ncbi:MAG: hypothetical protein ACK56F_05760 [bacterium]
MSTTPAKSCSAVSTTPAKNLSPLSLTPVISPCHGFSLIAGVVDTGDKFIAGDKNKDAMEVEKVEGDKSAISPAAEVGHGRR